jgi:hypothetical protein
LSYFSRFSAASSVGGNNKPDYRREHAVALRQSDYAPGTPFQAVVFPS